MSVFLSLRQIFQNLFSNKGRSDPHSFEKKHILRGNFFSLGSYNIPHREKTEKGGEDAFVANKNLIAIADGVGGWDELGIDSSLYSKNLCSLIERLYAQDRKKYNKNPKNLLVDAVALNDEKGTSTSLILTIDDNKPIIYTSQIGDSGYIILRKIKASMGTRLKVLFQSSEQCKSFNYPYQVGTNGDNPNHHANLITHNVQNNDIIVCGSDGLFDNLTACHIIQTIMPFLDHDKIIDINLLSEVLAKSAFEFSLDPCFESPFAKKCRSFDGYGIGGKEDDITVVIAQVNID